MAGDNEDGEEEVLMAANTHGHEECVGGSDGLGTGLQPQEENQETFAQASPVIGSLHQNQLLVAAGGENRQTTAQAIPAGAVAIPPHHSALPSLDLAGSSSSTSRQSGRLRIISDANPPDDKTYHQFINTPGEAVSRGDSGPGPTPVSTGSELSLKQHQEHPQHQEDHTKASNKMIFTNLYKSPKSPLSRLRHPHQPIVVPVAQGPTDYSPDLVSKDKSKQKEAVKRHLKENVRNDWTFTWPQEAPPAAPSLQPSEQAEGDETSQDAAPAQKELEGDETALDSGEEADSDSEAESVYSTVSDDPAHWKPRLEWLSELSDDELPYSSPSPFKFDSPESVGHAVAASKIARKARRRRELRKEVAWNDGLACFEARRAAWTGEKVARVRPKLTSPLSPVSPRRTIFWRTQPRSMSSVGQAISPSTQPDDTPVSPTEGDTGNTSPSTALSPKTSRSDSQKQPEILPVETLLPIPPPLLPPANPMRASINPTLYNSIYEKVVVNSLQPSCPINLSDMIRACVSGWKRDGEWPPRSVVPESAAVVAVRRKKSSKSAIVSSSTAAHAPAGGGRKMSFSFLGGGHGRAHEHDSGKAARRESAAGVEDGGPGPGKAIRRSLQRVLGIGQTMVTAADGHAAVQDH